MSMFKRDLPNTSEPVFLMPQQLFNAQPLISNGYVCALRGLPQSAASLINFYHITTVSTYTENHFLSRSMTVLLQYY